VISKPGQLNSARAKIDVPAEYFFLAASLSVAGQLSPRVRNLLAQHVVSSTPYPASGECCKYIAP